MGFVPGLDRESHILLTHVPKKRARDIKDQKVTALLKVFPQKSSSLTIIKAGSVILHRTEEPSSTSKYCDLFSLSQLVGETLQGATNIFLRSCNEMEKILFTKIPRIEKGIVRT